MLKTFIRTERHQIKPSNTNYKYFDDLLFKAKNLYNYALYTQRQIYFGKDPNIDSKKQYLNYNTLYQYIKDTEPYKDMPSILGIQILKQVCTNFYSFIKASKEYTKNPSKYLGKPKLPKYKDKKTGRYKITFTNQNFRFKDENHISFHKILKGFAIKTKLNPNQHTLLEARLIPRQNYIVLEIVYEVSKEVSLSEDFKYLSGIDLGLSNLVTISILKPDTRHLIINGKGLKSYNQYFNKKLSTLKSEAMKKHGLYTTKRIQRLYKKRNNYIETFLHKTSRKVVQYLYENKVKAVIIGKNKNWKQSSKLSTKVNQDFIPIPHSRLIEMITYKAQELGIKIYLVEESYTSGTSYLDNEQPTKDFYNPKRRIHRGLFKTNEGLYINSDVNAAFQIIKKAYKTDFKPIYNLDLNPIKINVA